MISISLDLNIAQDAISMQLPNGDIHICTEDNCDCVANQYGKLCRHRQFIYAMGGFDALKEVILKERRAVQRKERTQIQKENSMQPSIKRGDTVLYYSKPATVIASHVVDGDAMLWIQLDNGVHCICNAFEVVA